MKLIIDIPDRIQYGIEHGITVNGSEASQIVLDAVKNGTPLDSVKFHIEHMVCKQYEHRLTLDRQEVIDILDNFIGKDDAINNDTVGKDGK